MLTEGGRSPTGVSKTGQLRVPAAFGSAISSQGRPWECGWLVVSSASSESASLHRNRTLGNYRTALGRSCGYALLCRCAKAFSDELFCEHYEAYDKAHPTDGYVLSLPNV